MERVTEDLGSWAVQAAHAAPRATVAPVTADGAVSQATRSRTRIIEIDPSDDPRWDEFVRGHPTSTIHHLGTWGRILRSAYGFKPAYLALEADGRIDGALPLMAKQGVVTGRALRSLPPLGPVDPLARSDEGRRLLLEAACTLTVERGARSWTLLAREHGYELLEPRLRLVRSLTTFIARLPDDADVLRNGWKTGRVTSVLFDEGVRVREGTDEADLRRFYAMYLQTMRRHCSLPRSYKMFAAARESLSALGAYRLLLAEHEGEVIAGGAFNAWGDTLDLAFNASLERHFSLRPNHAIYWNAIRWAIENGYRRYDMGQALPGGSLARFKEQWGGERVDLYEYKFVPGTAHDASGTLRRASSWLDTGEGRETLPSKIWGRAPLLATRVAGQLVYRYF